MAKPIADQVSLCLNAFESVIDILSDQEDFALCNSEKYYVENLNKFKIWAGNIGAHRRGQSSLDYRLRDASHIQKTVLRFLSNLQSNLTEVASGECQIPEEWSDSDDDSESGDANVTTPAIELKQISVVIRETIRCLLRLSMTIQNPASHDRYMNGISIDTSYFEAFDTQHVRSKYPDADAFICQRLGKAISNRRQFLKYSQNHRRRLKAGIDGTIEDSESTVASSLAPVHKVGISVAEKMEDDRASQTSFATTVASSDKLRVPPLPHDADYGKEFECSICYCIISVSNWIGWKQHIFNDLQPYVCVAEDCKTPNKMFSQRGAWHNHVRQESATLSATNVCPLCRKGFSSARLWRSHVGKEMQQLALFAVPMHLYEVGIDDDDEIKEGSALSDAISSVHSEDSVGVYDALDAGEDSQELFEDELTLDPDPDPVGATPSLSPNNNDDVAVDDAGQDKNMADVEEARAKILREIKDKEEEEEEILEPNIDAAQAEGNEKAGKEQAGAENEVIAGVGQKIVDEEARHLQHDYRDRDWDEELIRKKMEVDRLRDRFWDQESHTWEDREKALKAKLKLKELEDDLWKQTEELRKMEERQRILLERDIEIAKFRAEREKLWAEMKLKEEEEEEERKQIIKIARIKNAEKEKKGEAEKDTITRWTQEQKDRKAKEDALKAKFRAEEEAKKFKEKEEEAIWKFKIKMKEEEEKKKKEEAKKDVITYWTKEQKDEKAKEDALKAKFRAEEEAKKIKERQHILLERDIEIAKLRAEREKLQAEMKLKEEEEEEERK